MYVRPWEVFLMLFNVDRDLKAVVFFVKRKIAADARESGRCLCEVTVSMGAANLEGNKRGVWSEGFIVLRMYSWKPVAAHENYREEWVYVKITPLRSRCVTAITSFIMEVRTRSFSVQILFRDTATSFWIWYLFTGLPVKVFLWIERQIRIQIHTHTPIYARAQRERVRNHQPGANQSPAYLSLEDSLAPASESVWGRHQWRQLKKKRCDLIPTKTLPGVTKGMGWK